MKRLLLLLATATLLVTIAAAGPASAQYQPMFCTVTPLTVPIGSTFTVTAGYFAPGSDVEIRIESDPVVLGSLVAQSDGTVTGSYALPLGIAVGSHTVFATGPRLGTNIVTEFSTTISVIDAGVSPASATPGATSTGALPQTGFDPAALLALGAALLAAGGLLLIDQRNRRRVES